MYLRLWDLYNSFDTRSKRCLIIDLYSILFIILPNRYFLSKMKELAILLMYLLYIVKGKDDIYINDNKYIHNMAIKSKYNII